MLHPGYVSHGPASPLIMRLDFLLWARFLLLLECCLQQLVETSETPTPGTKDFAVLLLQREQGTDLKARLAEAKYTAAEWRTLINRGKKFI